MSDVTPSTLTAETAEELLRPVYPTASVTDVIQRTGGQLSTVFELRCAPPTEPVIVKIYADQWRWKQEKGSHVYQLLEQHGVGPAPRVLHTQDADGPLGQAHTITTRLDGVPLSAVSHDLPDAELRRVYRQLGACLARLHRVPQPAFGYLTTRILDPERTNRGALPTRGGSAPGVRRAGHRPPYDARAAARAVGRGPSGRPGALTACRRSPGRNPPRHGCTSVTHAWHNPRRSGLNGSWAVRSDAPGSGTR